MRDGDAVLKPRAYALSAAALPPSAQARVLWEAHGERTEAVVRADPYELLQAALPGD